MSTSPGGDEPRTTARYRGLVIVSGSFSHVNEGIRRGLLAARPDLEFDVIDVAAVMRRRIWPLLRCCAEAVLRFGPGSLRSRSILRFRMLRTLAYNDEIAKIVRDRFASGRYDFTLQTQSLFNARQAGCPHFVYTDHAALARDYDAGDAEAVRPKDDWLEFERGIYAEADHVFTFGPNIRRVIIDKYGIPSDRVSAVGAGATVVPTRLVDTSEARYARRRILFVGVDWERKGGPELIAAFRLVRKVLPDSTLTIVGCSPKLDAEGCNVLGRLPAKELEALFHDASCFCMPSRVEPFGIVYAEAQLFGLPVVATDVGDVGAIITDGMTGRLVPPGDIGAIAAALQEVLGRPERCQAFGRAGIVRGQSFTWEAVARRVGARLPDAKGNVLRRTDALW